MKKNFSLFCIFYIDIWASDEISKEVIKLVYKKFYARLFGELMVYTPHSGNYIPPGVLQFCQEKY